MSRLSAKNSKSAKSGPSSIAQNRKARHDYDILETFEAGLVLTGSEVKSLRAGNGNITEAFVTFKNEEIWLNNSFISVYSHGGYANHDERRARKLLLHKSQIIKLQHKKEKGGNLTLVPLKLYWSKGKVKAEIALVQGRKQHDKRAAIKEREWNIQKQRMFKG